MKQIFFALVLSLSLIGNFGCAKKKVKPEAESNESRKSRSWDYNQVDKNREADQAEEAEHKDCKAIKTGAYAGYYENEKKGRHLDPHHDNCRPVDPSKGLGEGFFESDDLGPHKIGHTK